MATENEVENFLAHHGVKGMHWGVRKAERAARNQSIHDARARNISRIQEASRQVDKLNLATTERGKVEAVKAIKKLQDDAEKSGDNALASKSTTGEKVAQTLIAGAIGATLLSAVLH